MSAFDSSTSSSSSSKPLPARALKRVQKELQRFQEDSVNDSTFRVSVQSDDVWLITFTGAAGTLYAGETYTLRVRFTPDYPMDSPECVFLLPAPVHTHIYSNGHICLNILGDDWSPALTARSICMSVLSMLSSATVKEPPQDDASYSRRKSTGGPKSTRFIYHDDTV
mmetsp:Transcript_16261/g.23704  ORF Transcript_16261/g.23704 Transcript_16261/m.23704 type:complete len:167 (-) Transcript_16261:190-690(-)